MSNEPTIDAWKAGDPCPQCKDELGVVYPREDTPYCENCGWPESDFDKEGEGM